MKKNTKIIVFILVVLIGSYFVYNNFYWKKEVDKKVEFWNLETKVEKKKFDLEVEVTWNTKIKNEQKLKFNTSWKIVEVNFSAWDPVKKWDRLVAIEATKAQSEIDKAKIELEKSQRNLEKVISDIKDTKFKNAAIELKTAKMNIEKKELDISFMKQKLNQDLKTKESELEIAKNQYIIDDAKLRKDLAVSKYDSKNNWNSLNEKNLSYEKQKRDYEDAKTNLNAKVEKKVNEYKLKIENAYYDLEKDVRDYKEYLRIMWKILSLNDYRFPYEKYFSAKNNLNVWKIKEHYFKANEKFKKFEESFKKISSKNDSKNIIETLKIAKPFYEDAYFAFTYLEQWFNDSVVIDDTQEQNDFNSYKNSVSPALSRASSMRTSISTLVDDLKDFDGEEKIKKDLKDEIEKQRIAIENMEIEISKFQNESNFSNNTLNASQKNILLNLEELKNSLDRKKLEFEKYKKTLNDEYNEAVLALEKEKIAYNSNQKEFEKLKNVYKNEEYLAAEDFLKQSKLNLENAVKQLENYVILAPFDWILTAMDYKVWDRITENSDISLSIVDPKTIEIIVPINQNDIIKVKKDMEANIVLEAYPDKVLKWKLTEIDTTPTIDQNTNLSKFMAKVLILDYGDLKLYTWMKATVKIKVSSVPESVIIPFSALNSDADWKKYVTVMNAWKKEKRYVEVWENIWGFYKVLKWLKEGETILEIDYDASKIKEDEKSQIIDGANIEMIQ